MPKNKGAGGKKKRRGKIYQKKLMILFLEKAMINFMLKQLKFWVMNDLN